MADAATIAGTTCADSPSTLINLAGGGVSTELTQLRESPNPEGTLTTDKGHESYLVLRAPRGARPTCARALRSGLVADAFELLRVVMRREGGMWVARTESVWPGYVLAEPARGTDAVHVAEELVAVGTLTAGESALVRRLGGDAHVIQPSQGRITDGELTVLFGPLMGLEPLVTKIDRHKRLAWLAVGQGGGLPVCLEVTSKS